MFRNFLIHFHCFVMPIDCDADEDCGDGLLCFQRDENELVPGCVGAGELGWDYCFAPVPPLTFVGDFEMDFYQLQECEGGTISSCKCLELCFDLSILTSYFANRQTVISILIALWDWSALSETVMMVALFRAAKEMRTLSPPALKISASNDPPIHI